MVPRCPALIVKSPIWRCVHTWAMWSVLIGERAVTSIFVNNRPWSSRWSPPESSSGSTTHWPPRPQWWCPPRASVRRLCRLRVRRRRERHRQHRGGAPPPSHPGLSWRIQWVRRNGWGPSGGFSPDPCGICRWCRGTDPDMAVPLQDRQPGTSNCPGGGASRCRGSSAGRIREGR